MEVINPVCELIPGHTYVIEYSQHLSEKARDRVGAALEFEEKRLNIKLLFLSGGMKIARYEELGPGMNDNEHF